MAYTQVIEGRYIDRKKLVSFLRKTFGERGYRVRVRQFGAGFGMVRWTNDLRTDAIRLLDLDSSASPH